MLSHRGHDLNGKLRDSINLESLLLRIVLNVILLIVCILAATNSFGAELSAHGTATHVKVYSEPGRFGGWPANHGIWSWGDEILVGFSAGYFKDNGPGRHAIDHDQPEEHLLA